MGSGYEGVREIQKRLTNTMGWSATSGQVSASDLPLNHHFASPDLFIFSGHCTIAEATLLHSKPSE